MSAPSGQTPPPYARVAADIRARITAGDLGPGDRVPSTREITREWGVAMATATKALSVLRQEGLVEAVRGVGSVVRAPAAPDPAGAAAPVAAQPRDSKHRPDRSPAAADSRRRPTSEVPLTREAIVRAAIAIADAEGFDGLSMRRVATELRVSTMALYRHITGKAELATEMIDAIYRDAALPEPPPADWRQALELAMLREWDLYRQHPWAVRLTPMAGSLRSPGLMANGEWMLSVITAQGHSPDIALAIVTILSAYTSGMCLQGMQAAVDEDELGLDFEQWWLSKAEEFAQLRDGGSFPVVFSVSGPPDVDRIFTPGMTRLLDGLAPWIAPEE